MNLPLFNVNDKVILEGIITAIFTNKITSQDWVYEVKIKGSTLIEMQLYDGKIEVHEKAIKLKKGDK